MPAPLKPEQLAAYSLIGIAFVALAGGFVLLNLPAAPAPRPLSAAPPALSQTQAAQPDTAPRPRRQRARPRIVSVRPNSISDEERYSPAQSTEVWADTNTHRYYRAGSLEYDHTADGVYMSLEDAQRLGYERGE